MADKILCVDDDPGMLAAYRMLQGQQRQAREAFHIETVPNGEAGLEAIRSGTSYAVIISDMEMPGIDDVQFLCRVREIAPASVRMMLTGYAELQVAVDAVNEGHIFRFLTKPCSWASLSQAIAAGVRQYRLLMAEKELLEKTLAGSIKLLSDVLALVRPAAFSSLEFQGLRGGKALARMRHHLGRCDPAVLDVLRSLVESDACVETKELFVRDLLPPLEAEECVAGRQTVSEMTGDPLAPMVLAEDVRTNSGVLVLSQGQKITPALLQRLRNLARNSIIREPIRVWVPRGEALRQRAVASAIA